MMKKLIFLLIPFLGLLIAGCDSSEDPMTPAEPGSILVTSSPDGAQIWLDGTNTSLVTPDTITNVGEGVHTVTLILNEYRDTTFSISVNAGEMSVVGPITLVSDINTTFYSNPVRLWETTGTSASQPSGLDLSAGNAWGVSSDSSGLVDIYYSSNGFLVQSADLYTGLIRETDFRAGNSADIYDGIDSPERTSGTWTNNIPDTETNYVFLYDHDGHYSKLKIINRGGGVPGNPAWVEVIWYYNNDLQDERF
jgi:hypothetical protein